MTGAGIEAAVDGAEVIVHCAGTSKGDEAKARNLVRAASGVRHLVYISVVGADRVSVVSRVDRAMASSSERASPKPQVRAYSGRYGAVRCARTSRTSWSVCLAGTTSAEGDRSAPLP